MSHHEKQKICKDCGYKNKHLHGGHCPMCKPCKDCGEQIHCCNCLEGE